MTPTEKKKQIIKTLKRRADLDLKQNLALWSEKDMINMCKQDHKDLYKLAAFINKRAFKKAYRLIWDVDTEVRESIPDTVYKYVEKFV